ncbi:5-oxoprolinase/urea amidolyase family protein [Streptacidiphilus sp. N1-12]|uniref:5-oxoprolinase/urea amidolyase family protein n=2 Tax=Streptacidiphilus alkalitolerans TaxID=3342712 RepID=A0ABV6WLI2_9ACTN
MSVTVRRVGRSALLLEVAGDAEVAGLLAELTKDQAAGRLGPVAEVVPAARTVLLDGVEQPARVAARYRGCTPDPVPAADGPLVEVPTVYDGADLAEVAAQWGVSAEAAVRIHAEQEYRVAFCGFAPGFAYLTGLPERYAVPRRATPRTRVPAGSVALAGTYTGVYPGPSPGGWQLLGRTGLPLWDPAREPAALLVPGTRVRFRPVGPEAVSAGAHGASHTTGTGGAAGGRAVEVLRPGPLTTVQDAGRTGVAALGVPRAGALDPVAFRLANLLVGNTPGAAVLETTLGGVALRALVPLVAAVVGAPAPVLLDGRPAAWGAPVPVPAGGVLELGAASSGVRCWLALSGGVDVPRVLGSRSADLLSGLGPAPLAAGQRLPLGPVTGPPLRLDGLPLPAPPRELPLRLEPGPREDWFTEAALRLLATARYTVSPASNRVGLRLAGPALERRPGRGELPSEGMVLGAVQVPPDGLPVVFLADHPTTGGYPVVGVVRVEDLSAAAQAAPGTPVRFIRSSR